MYIMFLCSKHQATESRASLRNNHPFVGIIKRPPEYLFIILLQESIKIPRVSLFSFLIVSQSFMSLSIFCRNKSISIQCESAGRGEDKEMQPGEREIERSSVRHKAAQSAQPAQHNDRRLCLQIHV